MDLQDIFAITEDTTVGNTIHCVRIAAKGTQQLPTLYPIKNFKLGSSHENDHLYLN